MEDKYSYQSHFGAKLVVRKLYTSNKSSFNNIEEESERTTNIFDLGLVNGLESVTRGVDPVQGHLYLLPLREWAPDNGIVVVITDDVIRAVLRSVKSSSLLNSNAFAEELGQDDLLVYSSVLDSLKHVLLSEEVES